MRTDGKLTQLYDNRDFFVRNSFDLSVKRDMKWQCDMFAIPWISKTIIVRSVTVALNIFCSSILSMNSGLWLRFVHNRNKRHNVFALWVFEQQMFFVYSLIYLCLLLHLFSPDTVLKPIDREHIGNADLSLALFQFGLGKEAGFFPNSYWMLACHSNQPCPYIWRWITSKNDKINEKNIY